MLRWLWLASAVLVAGAASAQTPHRESVEVRLTNLDVVVTDRSGARVEGLTADDFTVFENGRPQAITNFTEFRGGSIADEAARVPRRIAMFIDTLAIEPARREQLRTSLLELVERGIRDDDLVTVFTWRGGLSAETPFTSNRPAVTAAIDRAVGRTASSSDPGEQRALDLEQEWFTFVEGAYQASQASRGSGFDREGHLDMNVDARSRRAYAEVLRRAAALEQWMGAVAGVEGRKVLLIASTRMTMNASSAFEAAAGRREAPRNSRWSTEPLLAKLATAANASGVTMYAIHPEGAARVGAGAEVGGTIAVPEGVTAQRTSETIRSGEQDALALLAESTGGEMAFGPGEIGRLVETLAADLAAYYSIGYRPSASPGAKERKVEVRVSGGHRARTRRAVLERTSLDRARDQVVANLVHPAESGGLRFSATPGEDQPMRDGRVVPIELKIPIAALNLVERNGVDEGEVSVLVASGGGYDTSAVSEQTQAIRIPAAEREKAKSGHFTYALDVELHGPSCCISIGVLDRTSASLGLVRLDLRAGRQTIESAPAPSATQADAVEAVTITEARIAMRSLAEVMPSDAPGVQPTVQGEVLADPAFLHAAELSVKGTPEEAIAAWQGVIYARPNDALAHHNLGVLYLRIEEWRKAVDAFTTSLRILPTNDVAQYNLAYALYRAGNKRAAARAARRVLDLNPNYEKARTLLEEIQGQR